MTREDYLQLLIKEQGFPSLKSFSEFAGMPYTTLRSMLERGIGKASVDNVIKVCKALGITVEKMEQMAAGVSSDEIQTIAAHHNGNEWTDEELEEIEKFKEFVRMKKNKA